MIIFWGTWLLNRKNKRKEFGICEHCNKQATIESYDASKFFHLYAIPLIPLGKKRVVDKCGRCSRYKEIPFDEWERLLFNFRQNLPQRTQEVTGQPAEALALFQEADFYLNIEEVRAMATLLESQFPENYHVIGYLAQWYKRNFINGEAARLFARLETLDDEVPLERAAPHFADAEAYETQQQGEPEPENDPFFDFAEGQTSNPGSQKANNPGSGARNSENTAMAQAMHLLEQGRLEEAAEAFLRVNTRADVSTMFKQVSLCSRLLDVNKNQEAYRLMVHLIGLYPKMAGSHDKFRQDVKRAELRLGLAESALPKKSNKNMMIGLGAAAAFIGFIVLIGIVGKKHPKLVLVNGTPQNATVDIGGESHDIYAYSDLKLELEEGEYDAVTYLKDGQREDVHISLFESGVGEQSTKVYNLFRAGVVAWEEVAYTQSNSEFIGRDLEFTLFDRNTVFDVGHSYYEFEEFPEELRMKSSYEIRDRVYHEKSPTMASLLIWLEDTLNPMAPLEYLERQFELGSHDPDLADFYLSFGSDSEEMSTRILGFREAHPELDPVWAQADSIQAEQLIDEDWED